MYNNFKNEVNKRRENPDKPHTKTGNAPEDINNKNYETSETFEMEVIAECELNKEVMVSDTETVTIQ